MLRELAAEQLSVDEAHEDLATAVLVEDLRQTDASARLVRPRRLGEEEAEGSLGAAWAHPGASATPVRCQARDLSWSAKPTMVAGTFCRPWGGGARSCVHTRSGVVGWADRDCSPRRSPRFSSRFSRRHRRF